MWYQNKPRRGCPVSMTADERARDISDKRHLRCNCAEDLRDPPGELAVLGSTLSGSAQIHGFGI